MYFNEVEEGGGTRFPKLNNLTIQPRPGRVLIWPSVLDEEPYQMDGRTEHEALEVVKGEKYAANAWIHMRDFQTTMATGCPS
jgi:prolyl 4-hydroxylase